MYAWLLRKFTRHGPYGDSLGQVRKKDIIIKVCTLLLVCGSLVLAMRHTIPALQGTDEDQASAWDLWGIYLGVLLAWTLIHMYVFDLTPLLKVMFTSGIAAAIFWGDVINHNLPYHFGFVLLLNLCILLECERDAALMTWVSRVLRVLITVYVGVRALSHGGVLPTIHPFEPERSQDVHDAKALIVSEFLITMIPILLNYSFVKSYARSARKEARMVNESVEVATNIAGKLVNFDLDAAELLLGKLDVAQQSPICEPLNGLLRNLRSYRSFLPYSLFSRAEHTEPPNEYIADCLQGELTSWKDVSSAVSKLRDPFYTLGHFHRDVTAAFPELKLYKLESATCTSGHTGLEEYQRTLGALYSVYCLARLDMDGREILSFGVDERWQPRRHPGSSTPRSGGASRGLATAADKAESFYRNMDWEAMLQMMISANLLTVENARALPTTLPQLMCRTGSQTHSTTNSSNGSKSAGLPDHKQSARPRLRLNEERMTAMVVLTAIHDIMKNPNLLPTVQKRHAPYHGIAAGVRIEDHDLALAYVLEQFPSLMPSYYGLEPGQRAPVLFTQGKMGFNNGWLVQGEAPPGALFSNFKRVITEGCASESDVSFYFVHWLTDLAGAEPFGNRPWPGAEKFVAKFPHRVLNAFLESFSFIDRLATRSEVEVMEDYLSSRWHALGPPEQELEDGHSPAAMRLALMAQGFETEVVDALLALSAEDRETIASELAYTGCRQQFQSASRSLQSSPQGPALLVYYAPALIQKAGAVEARAALQVLASVFRAARELFPADGQQVERTLTVRIDALKVLTPGEIMAVDAWYIKKTSDSNAEVVQMQPEGSSVGDDGARMFAQIFVDASRASFLGAV